jgi:hypothetical protein
MEAVAAKYMYDFRTFLGSLKKIFMQYSRCPVRNIQNQAPPEYKSKRVATALNCSVFLVEFLSLSKQITE